MCLRKPSAIDAATLAIDNDDFRGTGGVSAGNRKLGFVPAFRDRATGRVEPARFADGEAAPFHCLDGVPAAWVAVRDAAGQAQRLVEGVEAGFLRDGRFYTRAQAALAVDGRTVSG